MPPVGQGDRSVCTELCVMSSDRCHAGGAWVGEGQVCQGLKMEEAAFKLDSGEGL